MAKGEFKAEAKVYDLVAVDFDPYPDEPEIKDMVGLIVKTGDIPFMAGMKVILLQVPPLKRETP